MNSVSSPRGGEKQNTVGVFAFSHVLFWVVAQTVEIREKRKGLAL